MVIRNFTFWLQQLVSGVFAQVLCTRAFKPNALPLFFTVSPARPSRPGAPGYMVESVVVFLPFGVQFSSSATEIPLLERIYRTLYIPFL